MRAHLAPRRGDVCARGARCVWTQTRRTARPLDAAHESSRAPLRETPPPAMAGVEMSLQERIRAGYASLTIGAARAGERRDLGRAYGQVGKLLLAAELYDQAEPHLLNAAALEPGELAWPYFLAHAYRLTFQSDKAIRAVRRRASSEARSRAGIGLARNHARRWRPRRSRGAAAHQGRVAQATFGGGALRAGKGGAGRR